MGLTLTTTPPAHNFVKNPMVFEITTNKYVTTAGVKFVGKIHFTAAPTVGPSSLVISFNGITVTMTGVTSVDDSGNQFRFKSGIESTDDWLSSFATACQNNFEIGSAFTMSVDTVNDDVIFTAKETGDDYNITFTTTPGTSTGSTVTAGVDEVIAANFHVILQLSVRDIATNEVAIVNLDMERVSNTLFRMRVEDAIRKYVTRTVPALVTSGIFASSTNTAYIGIRYYEVYGEPADEKYFYAGSALYYFALGGINEIEYPASTFLSAYTSQYKFLTLQKRSKYITKTQQEYLAWFHLSTDSNNDVEFKVVLYYTDGTTTTDYSVSLTGASSFKLYYGDTSYAVLVDPIADGGKTVDYYTVQVCVKTTHVALSEIMTYHVLQADTANTRYFLFANSLGWWDTLRTTGEQVRGVSADFEVFEKYLPHNYAVKDGRYVVSDAQGQRTFKQNTGLMDSKNIVDYLAELLINPGAFEIRAGKTIPIIITTASIRLSSDFALKDKYFIEFEYYEAYNYLELNSTTV